MCVGGGGVQRMMVHGTTFAPVCFFFVFSRRCDEGAPPLVESRRQAGLPITYACLAALTPARIFVLRVSCVVLCVVLCFFV